MEITAVNLTHSNSRVFSCRSYPLSVRAELDTVDSVGVTLVGEDATLSPDIPQFYRFVGRSGRQEVAIRMEVSAS